MNGIRYYLPGIILIMMAFLIMAVPEILVAFVAAVIIIAGAGALYAGHMMRKSEKDFRLFHNRFADEDLFSDRFVRIPLFRNWHRWF
jgi:hypothetical protein